MRLQGGLKKYLGHIGHWEGMDVSKSTVKVMPTLIFSGSTP
jgi:hypothetical protein